MTTRTRRAWRRMSRFFERHTGLAFLLGGLLLGLTILTAVLSLVVLPRIDEARDDRRALATTQQAQRSADEALATANGNLADFCRLAGTIGRELDGIRQTPTETQAGERFRSSLANIGDDANRAARSPACPPQPVGPPA